MTSNAPEGSAPVVASRWRRGAWWALGAALVLYMASPALFAGHLESVTAQTQSIAWLRAQRPEAVHDPYLPLVSQFVLETRSGVVLLLSAIFHVLPGASDGAFRALVCASLLVHCVASVVFAARVASVRVWAAALALALTPFVFETAFFFNDNAIATAFAATSLAMATRCASRLNAALLGALFAFGMQCRFDTVLAAPLVAAALWATPETRRERVLRLLSLGVAAVATHAAFSVYLGFSILDTLAIVPSFILWIHDVNRWTDVRLYALGLAAIPPLALGMIHFTRERTMRWDFFSIACFVVYPVVLTLKLKDISQVRYIFSLWGPIVALFVGLGLERGHAWWSSPAPRRRMTARAFVAFALAVFLAPVARVRVLEGPRSLYGRLRSVSAWRDWQRVIAENRVEMSRLARRLDDHRDHVVVSTHYNDEMYLRQRLIEAGFTPRATEEVFPGCDGFSVLQRGRTRILHVRTDPQYQIPGLTFAYNAALQIDAAFACPAVAAASSVVMTAFGESYPRVIPEVYGVEAGDFPQPLVWRFPDALSDLRLQDSELTSLLYYGTHDALFGYLRVKALDGAQVARMHGLASAYLAQHEERHPHGRVRATLASYRALYRARQGPTQRWLSQLHPAAR